MKTLSEVRAAQATAALGEVTEPLQIAAPAARLTRALGMQRYCILDLRGTMGLTVNGVHHNAPAQLVDELDNLGGLVTEAIVDDARISLIPFCWQADSLRTPWLHKHAAVGYRSGITAASPPDNH